MPIVCACVSVASVISTPAVSISSVSSLHVKAEPLAVYICCGPKTCYVKMATSALTM